MSKVDFTIDVSKAGVEYASQNYKVELTIDGVEVDDIITEIGAGVILDHMDNDDIARYIIDNNISIEG